MATQQQLRDLFLALGQRIFTEVFETLCQSLMHTPVAVIVSAPVIPAVPDSLHRGSDNGFDKSQPIQLCSGKSFFGAPANYDQCTCLRYAKQEVHFIDKVGAFNVLAIILTGIESIRLCIPKPAKRRFVRSQCHLVQGIEQVRTRQIAVEIVTGTVRGERVVHDLWRCVGMKRQQTCAVVRDG